MRLLACMLSVGLLLAGVVPSKAGTLLNPGFEEGGGSLIGWTAYPGPNDGKVEILDRLACDSTGQWLAPEGNYFAALFTDTGPMSDGFTSLRQTISLDAGDRVCFQYFFRDPSETYLAVALVRLVGNPEGSSIVLLDLAGTGDNTPSGVWSPVVSAPIPESGTYQLRIRIRDGGAEQMRAILGLDDFKAAAPYVIPEPMTLLAGSLGLAAVAGYVRKRLKA